MRGSLVIIAALCVIAAAEASSVKFVSADEGKIGKDKAHRSGVSEGTDPVIKKKVEEVVKKINDGEELLEKTVKSLDVERSSTGDKAPERAGEGVKKAASSEKSKVQKRDVRRTLAQLAKRGAKMARAEESNIFNAREIIVRYLSLQKTVTNKITTSLIFAVEHLETVQKEKEALIAALKSFQKAIEQAYDNIINSLRPKFTASDMYSGPERNFMRADDIPAIMNTMNQRNPLAFIPLLVRLISGVANAATIADLAVSFGNRSNSQDLAFLMEMIQTLLSTASLPQLSNYM